MPPTWALLEGLKNIHQTFILRGTLLSVWCISPHDTGCKAETSHRCADKTPGGGGLHSWGQESPLPWQLTATPTCPLQGWKAMARLRRALGFPMPPHFTSALEVSSDSLPHSGSWNVLFCFFLFFFSQSLFTSGRSLVQEKFSASRALSAPLF